MSADVLGGSGAIITYLGGIAILGGYMWQLLKGVNSRNEKKADELRKTTEENASGLKKATEDIATQIKKEADAREIIVRSYTDKTIDVLKSQINEVDNKVMTMLKDLADRSDLVNGNIKNIRDDIMDVQQDVIELYSADDIEYEARDNGRDVQVDKGYGRDPMSARKNKKLLEIARRKKRREIQEDSTNQEHPLYGQGGRESQRRR
jgi:hypothetical protein